MAEVRPCEGADFKDASHSRPFRLHPLHAPLKGTRQVSGFGMPLWLMGIPLQKVSNLGVCRSLTTVPLVGPLLALPLTPPSSVEAVARAAVDAALAITIQKVIDVDELQKYEKVRVKDEGREKAS